jgi:hypothetical protein
MAKAAIQPANNTRYGIAVVSLSFENDLTGAFKATGRIHEILTELKN